MRMLVVCLMVALAACRARDPSFRSESGERLSDFDPLPFHVAIAPLDTKILLTGVEETGQHESIWFAIKRNEVQDCLVALFGRRSPQQKRIRVTEQQYCIDKLNTFYKTSAIVEPPETPKQMKAREKDRIARKFDLAQALLQAREMNVDLLIIPAFDREAAIRLSAHEWTRGDLHRRLDHMDLWILGRGPRVPGRAQLRLRYRESVRRHDDHHVHRRIAHDRCRLVAAHGLQLQGDADPLVDHPSRVRGAGQPQGGKQVDLGTHALAPRRAADRVPQGRLHPAGARAYRNAAPSAAPKRLGHCPRVVASPD